MKPYDITNEELFKFYSNRALMNKCHTADFIGADIKSELGITYDEARYTYCKMYNCFEKIVENSISKYIDTDDMKAYRKYIKDTVNTLPDIFNKMTNFKYSMIRGLYRATYDNYVFVFLQTHKHVLPDNLMSIIANNIVSVTYCPNCIKLDSFIKKILILKVFGVLGKELMQYYSYCKFVFIFNRVYELDLIPIYYNQQTGSFYFDISFNEKHRKEQILERLHQNIDYFGRIMIDSVEIFINSRLGEIIKYYKAYTIDGHINKRAIIEDTFDIYCPNIIREMVAALVRNYSRKSSPHSYEKVLGSVISHNNNIIDYCQMITDNGTGFRIPYKGNNYWLCKDRYQLYLTTKEELDYKLLIEPYNDVLTGLTQLLVASKR